MERTDAAPADTAVRAADVAAEDRAACARREAEQGAEKTQAHSPGSGTDPTSAAAAPSDGGTEPPADRFAAVVIDGRSKATDALYTYRVPYRWESGAESRVGDRVLAPFGRSDGERVGYIVRFLTDPGCPPARIKAVRACDDSLPLTPEIMTTIVWLRQRYAITYADGLRCFLPQGGPPRDGRPKTPYADLHPAPETEPTLTDEQAAALKPVREAILAREQTCFLLHGVTASGKTEVYMRAIETALSCGRGAIMLVPEIALTRQVIERFAARFGKAAIAVLHSKLTRRERYDEWQRIRRGEARIVIGARMGVFAPLADIGLIIMDEEHEATYKADMTPKYETVDVALKRLKSHDGVLLLGSATPSVVSYARCREGIYRLLELKKRYNETPLPTIEIVDMRAELRDGNTSIFSRILRQRLQAELRAGRQAILLQNRRGYANYLFCRTCGAAMKCETCGISLTYHKQADRMVCHYCGRRYPVPAACPACGSPYVQFCGVGTEQVEEAVGQLFPDVRTARLDLDTIRRRSEMDHILGDFSEGKTRILVGTQLVAKGLDFHNVGLVGVISADVTLNIPDYRSGERTFQLVTQVAGRAGRGREQGQVILQTYEPGHYALLAAKRYDYEGFYRQEIRQRQLMEYPPFSDMLLVDFVAKDRDAALTAARGCVDYMKKEGGPEAAGRIYPPRAAQRPGSEEPRYCFLIKCPKGSRNRFVYLLDAYDRHLIGRRPSVQMHLDVNPYGLI